MKVTFTILIFFLGYQFTQAQAPANATVFDCSGNSKNIYNSLASGKSIIVLHKGVDCSICRNAAPGWETWAAANTTTVEVWGAITYTYSSSAFQPMCQKTLQWKSQYNWNNIFTFADSNRQWIGNSSPLYFVYSAVDSSIVYSGNNASTARSMAIAQSTVGLQQPNLEDAVIYYSNSIIYIKNLKDNSSVFSLFSMEGKLIVTKNMNSTSLKVPTENLKKGTYIIVLETADKRTISKKVLIL